ncbi:hypothetical protein [Legionella cincinnatiensis]|uniref:RavZ C-terminal PI3P-binding domain-containing protein n=1 Tax=Legionella cincinnatiensis TaxID=28085 RepID=A0A378II85_9GAMM|nr:hypothetical protein [Legionella cincinnatiensis]KTC93912.1 hypothetical protein Lcin_0097 [Legionella cincinnatiensis]STX34879.1 Uncharacterised protein [Legionella cincinnatiensis]
MSKDSPEVLNAKTTIIKNSIKEDQLAVAQQWLKTFKHNASDDPATNISKLLLACVAQGEFKTRSSLVKTKELTNPSDVLTSIDYLSHASRVIVDYKNLSTENLKEFLAFFPEAGSKGIVSRSATHGVIRKGEKITELKGFMLGVMGQIPTLIKTPYDFGVNIAMGGENEKNLIGKNINKNGFSGHMYFHHYTPDQLMMLGLEQSAPSSSILEALWGHPKEDESIQSDTDQFGQGHSLTGASDTFTAAGSLYFSDPVYQAKLLTETGNVTPDKYGAMQVSLNDDNWPKIKEYLETLTSNFDKGDEFVLEQIMTPPSTAVKKDLEIESYIALDFKTYLKNIRPLLEEVDPSVFDILVESQMKLQSKLLLNIETLSQGYTVDGYQQFLKTLQQISEVANTPKAYIEAISRVRDLFELQRKIDPKLKQTHDDLIIQQRCNELVLSINNLETKAKLIRKLLSSESYIKEDNVSEYLEHLSTHMKKLEEILKIVSSGFLVEEMKIEKEVSIEDSLILQENLENSWINLKSLKLADLDEYEMMMQKMGLFLQQCPVEVEKMLKVQVIEDYTLEEKPLEIEPIKDDITDFMEAVQKYYQTRNEKPEIAMYNFWSWSKQAKKIAADVLIDILQSIKEGKTITETQCNNLAIHKRCIENGEFGVAVQTYLKRLGFERLEQLVETKSEDNLFDVPDITEKELATVNDIQPLVNTMQQFKLELSNLKEEVEETELTLNAQTVKVTVK